MGQKALRKYWASSGSTRHRKGSCMCVNAPVCEVRADCMNSWQQRVRPSLQRKSEQKQARASKCMVCWPAPGSRVQDLELFGIVRGLFVEAVFYATYNGPVLWGLQSYHGQGRGALQPQIWTSTAGPTFKTSQGRHSGFDAAPQLAKHAHSRLQAKSCAQAPGAHTGEAEAQVSW